MSDMISKAKFAKHIKQVTVPQGFVASMEVEDLWKNCSQQVFVLKSDDIEIRFDQNGCGHTIYSYGGRKYTFDRRGIEDSFYHLPLWGGDESYDLNLIIAEQLDRVTKSLKIIAKSIDVPGVPFTTTPERLEHMKKQLKSGGQVSFTPQGFGTGYIISYGAKHHSDAKRAPKATEDFFGVSSLYISTFDAD